MIYFYLPSLHHGINQLSAEESHHCVKVLRLSRGMQVAALDGKGKTGYGVVGELNPAKCTLNIEQIIEQSTERPYKLHIAIAPTKNISRFEWFLEKATEIGIDEITPLLCTRSERKVIKIPRLQKIILAAMKQSGHTYLPALREPISFKTFITQSLPKQSFIANAVAGSENLLYSMIQPRQEVLLLIGPEGDFTPEEIDLAKKRGFRPASLGNNRYRTETAGLIVCNALHVLNTLT